MLGTQSLQVNSYKNKLEVLDMARHNGGQVHGCPPGQGGAELATYGLVGVTVSWSGLYVFHISRTV